VSVPPIVCEAAVFIRSVLEEYAESGRPLWPPVASSLYAAFLAGDAGSARVVVITWDSSLLEVWNILLFFLKEPEVFLLKIL
jgi:hypothetical protein